MIYNAPWIHIYHSESLCDGTSYCTEAKTAQSLERILRALRLCTAVAPLSVVRTSNASGVTSHPITGDAIVKRPQVIDCGFPPRIDNWQMSFLNIMNQQQSESNRSTAEGWRMETAKLKHRLIPSKMTRHHPGSNWIQPQRSGCSGFSCLSGSKTVGFGRPCSAALLGAAQRRHRDPTALNRSWVGKPRECRSMDHTEHSK